MRVTLLYIFLMNSVLSISQNLLAGNIQELCISQNHQFIISESLPENISEFSVIYLFSNATSVLTMTDCEVLIDYVEKGGGLYLGGENWPLQSEFNQMTSALYNKESYGNFSKALAEAKKNEGNLHLEQLDIIPAGTSTTAFPLDYRLTVEAWVEDQPLILSGKIGQGRIVLDGGYSRFYCKGWNDNVDAVFIKIQQFLSN